MCEALTEMKSVSGVWRADFHPHWGHCPPQTATNGWVGNAPMTSLLLLSIYRWWFCSSHFPVLSSEQENAVNFPISRRWYLPYALTRPPFLLYWPAELPFTLLNSLSFTPLERLFFFQADCVIIFFFHFHRFFYVPSLQQLPQYTENVFMFICSFNCIPLKARTYFCIYSSLRA